MQKLLKHFLFLNHKCYYIYNNLLEILKDFYIKMFIIKIIQGVQKRSKIRGVVGDAKISEKWQRN